MLNHFTSNKKFICTNIFNKYLKVWGYVFNFVSDNTNLYLKYIKSFIILIFSFILNDKTNWNITFKKFLDIIQTWHRNSPFLKIFQVGEWYFYNPKLTCQHLLTYNQNSNNVNNLRKNTSMWFYSLSTLN